MYLAASSAKIVPLARRVYDFANDTVDSYKSGFYLSDKTNKVAIRHLVCFFISRLKLFRCTVQRRRTELYFFNIQLVFQ